MSTRSTHGPAGYGEVVGIAAFFGFFVLGLLFNRVLATSTYPAPDEAAGLIAEWRSDNGAVARIAGAAMSVSALVFTWFTSTSPARTAPAART